MICSSRRRGLFGVMQFQQCQEIVRAVAVGYSTSENAPTNAICGKSTKATAAIPLSADTISKGSSESSAVRRGFSPLLCYATAIRHLSSRVGNVGGANDNAANEEVSRCGDCPSQLATSTINEFDEMTSPHLCGLHACFIAGDWFCRLSAGWALLPKALFMSIHLVIMRRFHRRS